MTSYFTLPIARYALLISLVCSTLVWAKDATSSVSHSENEHPIARVDVHNPSDFDRPNQTLYFSFYDLGLEEDVVANFKVKKHNLELANHVVDIDSDGTNDGVLVLMPLLASETTNIDISLSSDRPNNIKRTQAEVSHKQDGKWGIHAKQPDSEFKSYKGGSFVNVTSLTPPKQHTDHSYWIRYEGPGIESDKVGYRVYLDHRNGFDIFGKKTSEPILHTVGQDGFDSYHEMQPWGVDILKVGSSLGAGGFGLWFDEKLELVSDVESLTASINSNGDLYSAFTIDYQGWLNSAGKQDIAANISMQAGSRLAQVKLSLSKTAGDMAIGMVKHANTELITGNVDITGKAYTYLASWGAQALDGGMLGMAVFFKKENLKLLTQDDANYLAVLTPKGSPTQENPDAMQLEYYFAAVWQGESGIGSKEEFIQYLEEKREALTIEPRVYIKSVRSEIAKQQKIPTEHSITWSTLLADSILQRKGYTYNYDGWDVNRKRKPKFEYDIVGLLPNSFYRLALASGEDKYKKMIHKVTSSFVTEEGELKRYKLENFNIDSVAPGSALLSLYQETKAEKYKQAATRLRKQLSQHPKTSEGAFWHKKIYPHQLWLDGVYMGMPFLADYTNLFESGHALEEVVNEFALTRKHLREPDSGLYYHGWDEAKIQAWADPKTGNSPEFWARGMGWMAMALIDVLDAIPVSRKDLRKPLLEMSAEIALSLVATQDPSTGTWWQIMDKPSERGNYRESSATAMFVYFLASAVERGLISEEYREAALKGYQGLINEFVLVHADGTISMTNQCYVAGLGFGRDGSYQYYMSEPVWNNDPKGTVPLILAGIAIHELVNE